MALGSLPSPTGRRGGDEGGFGKKVKEILFLSLSPLPIPRTPTAGEGVGEIHYYDLMNLSELHASISKALAQVPGSAPLHGLAVEAERMADMTGWATGPIDPQGKIAAAFELLKLQIRMRFEETQSPEVAVLHDAIGDLLAAIAAHDDDLNPDGIGVPEDD